MRSALSPLLQEPASWFGWTHVWLSLGAMMLVLFALAFGYLLLRQRQDWIAQLADWPALRRIDQFLSDHASRLWAFIQRRFTPGARHGLELTVIGTIVFITLLLFLLITKGWTDQEVLYALDQQIYWWLMDASTGSMLAFMDAITHLGNRRPMVAMCIATGLLLLYGRHYELIVILVLAPGLGSLVVVGLKRLFQRVRPEMQVTAVAGYSFPSGHAFAAMSFFGFLIYLTWRFTSRDAIRLSLTLVLIMLILLVGASRIALRVHWFTDVAGGFAAGLGWLVCCIFFVRSMRLGTS